MQAQNPLVSVIITTCNREYFFTQALQSVQNQSYKNLEIIISDDNSEDETKELALEFAESDPRIKVVSNTHAHGSAGNRNNGIDNASGELLVLLDDDDELLVNAIENLVNAYLEQNKECGIIIANCRRSDDSSLSGLGLFESREIRFNEVLSGGLRGEFLTCFRRDLLGARRFNEDLKRGNMGLLWLRMHKKTRCFYIHKALKIYRIHAESLTNTLKYEPLEMVKNYEQDILLFYKERKELCPAYLARLCAIAALLYRLGGARAKCLTKVRQSMQIRPNVLAFRVFGLCLMPDFLSNFMLPKINFRLRVEK